MCVCVQVCMQKNVCMLCVHTGVLHCVHAYVHAEGCMCVVCACTCPRMWVQCPPPSLPTLFLQIGSLTELGAHHRLHGWSVIFRELPDSAPSSFPSTEVTGHCHHLVFYSCPQIRAASTLPAKLLPQFPRFIFETGSHSPDWLQTHCVVETGFKAPLLLPLLPTAKITGGSYKAGSWCFLLSSDSRGRPCVRRRDSGLCSCDN